MSSKRKWYATLKGQLLEVVAAIEETNRVLGLSRLVEQVRKSGRTTLTVLEQFRRNASEQDAEQCPYMAWGLPDCLDRACVDGPATEREARSENRRFPT